jgi:hypothetical protein
LSASDSTAAQVLPHAVVPPGHPQEDERQTSEAVHAVPHPPQLSGSAVVSTQAPPHSLNGEVHAPTHSPAWHWGVEPEHAVPHAPQFFGSAPSSLHVVPQAFWPCAHEHEPATQLLADGHVSPHFPQFSGSVDASTHADPHCASPTAHADAHDPLEQTSPFEQA